MLFFFTYWGRNKDTVRIIALTANAFIEDKNACLEAGMNAHLSKPIRKQVLFDCIARELARVWGYISVIARRLANESQYNIP